MKKLWIDVRTHRRAATLLTLYWLATLAIATFNWDRGIPAPVVGLLFTPSLLAGLLVGRWRAAAGSRGDRGQRLQGGSLAGLLIALSSLLVMKGGVLDEFVGWLGGARFQGGEVLEFMVFTAIAGAVLGLLGAALTFRGFRQPPAAD
ncbi:MAG: hypothetical protein WCI85_02370 [Comamonadaceae bacterium]